MPEKRGNAGAQGRPTKRRPTKPRRSPSADAAAIRVQIARQAADQSVDAAWLKKLARHALIAEKMLRAELSVALVDDAASHRLNRQYLNHDFPTDVLTFPFAKGKSLEGEIVVNLDFAARSAAEYGWSVAEETGLYLVHGILHLCDYDDSDDDQAQLMKERQEELLREFIRREGLPTQPNKARPREET